jgi:hypothetical protein
VAASFTLTAATLRAGLVALERAVRAAVADAGSVQVLVGSGTNAPRRRNGAQNDRLNAMCGDVAKQVVWHGQRLTRDDWRHMFVASFRKGQKVVPGIDGGFVVLGASSRQLTEAECSEVIELLFAFGAEHNVQWRNEK